MVRPLELVAPGWPIVLPEPSAAQLHCRALYRIPGGVARRDGDR